MSKFFDSELVKDSIQELEDIQGELFAQIMEAPFESKQGKKDHLDLMRQFLEKQKLFIFRMSLSDDPEAVEMKERIIDSAKLFGLPEGAGVDEFFKLMESQIDYLEKTLDD